MIKLNVLGAPQARTPTGEDIPLPPQTPLAILIFCLVEGRPVSKEEILQLFWPDSTPSRAKHSLSQALYAVRSAFPDVLVGSDYLEVKPNRISTDIDELNDAISDRAFADAQRIWRGDLFLGGYVRHASRWNDWLDEKRQALGERYSAFLIAVAGEIAQNGHVGRAKEIVVTALNIAPSSWNNQLDAIDLMLSLGQLSTATDLLDRARNYAGDNEEQVGDLSARHDVLVSCDSGGGHALGTLVGRSDELESLAKLWRDTRCGISRRVIIVGPAGFGKTRLLSEVDTIVARHGGRVVHVRISQGDGSFQWEPVVNLTQALLRMNGADEISTRHNSILQRAVNGGNTRSDHEAAFPDNSLLLGALIKLVSSVTAAGPLAVVIDDIRWAHESSRSLIHRLAIMTADSKVLFLFGYRLGPWDPQGRLTLRSFRHDLNETVLNLAPLSAPECRDLVASLTALNTDEAERTGALIHELTRGVPLFVIELMRYLRDHDFFVETIDGWKLRNPLDVDQLPTSLEGLIRDRLNDLQPEHRDLLFRLPHSLPRARSKGYAKIDDEAGDAFVAAGLFMRTLNGELEIANDALLEYAMHRRRPYRRYLARVALLLLIVLSGLGVGAAVYSRTTLPFGGGELLFLDHSTVTSIQTPRWPRKHWAIKRYPVKRAEGVVGSLPVRLADGKQFWMGTGSGITGGPYAVDLNNETPRVVMRLGKHDVNAQDVSPDGRSLLLTRDDPATKLYDLGLVVHDIPSRTNRLLYQGFGSGLPARFSPDGLLIAFGFTSQTDSIIILNSSGVALSKIAFPTIHSASWCGNRMLAIVADNEDGRVEVHLRHVISGRDRLVPRAHAIHGSLVACSPDGSGLMIREIIKGVPRYVLHDLQNGKTAVLIQPISSDISWQFKGARRIPARFILSLNRTMLLGEQSRYTAEVVYSDSSHSSVGLSLLTSDSHLIVGDSIITAAHAGTGAVRLYYEDVAVDSANIAVAPPRPPQLLISETLLPDQWQAFGNPTPTFGITKDGDHYVDILGDRNYTDGLATKDEYDIRNGLTLKLEFSLRLTERDGQDVHVSFCNDISDHGPLSSAVEFIFPAYLGPKFNAGLAAQTVGQVTDLTRTRTDLGDGKWHSLRIAILPDGSTEVEIDGAILNSSSARLSDSQQLWRVCLMGDAVRTQSRLRRIRLWRGLE